MKKKLFSLFGVLCIAIISYEYYARTLLWSATMGETTGRNREKYMALRDVFIEKYGNENIYQITNLDGVTGISILLGLISILFFILILNAKEKTTANNTINILKKILLAMLMLSSLIIIFLNLWTLM